MSKKQKARPVHYALRAENYSLPSPDIPKPTLVGRPLGEARKGKRYQIGVRVSGQVKSALARRAKENGRSLSSEIEHIIERVAELDRWLEMMRTSLAELERTAGDDVLRRKGYTAVPYAWASGTDAVTAKVWFPPGFPFDKFFRWQKAEEPK